MVPVGLPEEEATLTCDAKGFPAPRYRYGAAVSSAFHLKNGILWLFHDIAKRNLRHQILVKDSLDYFWILASGKR